MSPRCRFIVRGAHGWRPPPWARPHTGTLGMVPRLTLALAFGLLLSAPTGLDAQAGIFPGTSGSVGDPSFLFERPRISIGLRGGVFLHRAASDLYDFSTERFTVDRSDYRAVALGLEGGIWIGDRAELTVAIDGSRLTLESEYRDVVERIDRPDGSVEHLPIRQTTHLAHGPAVAFGARWYLRDRGDRLGQFIWIPNDWNAYVGAGGGITGYRLRMEGDFVDEATDIILADSFSSTGNVAFPFLSAGVERGLSTRTVMTLEGRYQWGSHELGPEFARDFVNPLDLAGARLSAGVHYRF